MPLDTLITLGPFLVDGAGRLQPGEPDRFPVFSVMWRDRAVRVRMDPSVHANEAGSLALHVTLGRVPSTAKMPGDSTTRDQAFATLRGLSALVPPRWELGLKPDHVLALEAHIPIDLPVTAVDLVSAVTGFLLELGPYLDVLDETGAAPAYRGGTAKICPG